ncbi:PIN domain-containing protein [Hydrogenophilus thiooxidans]|uniref:PIN domain-containing protein n=1 Tax=Hydrogenophilus thiooxidans TaxID=2820326 RepID=UPI001C240582
MVTPARAVLDTNTALALWWFEDQQLTPLVTAITTQRLEPIASPPLIAEWRALVSRLHAKETTAPTESATESAVAIAPPIAGAEAHLSARGIRAHAQFTAWVRPVDHPDASWLATADLPRCRDPEDQKFLECAWFHQATWLITRDKALLRLARRLKPGTAPLTIVTPEAWCRGDRNR